MSGDALTGFDPRALRQAFGQFPTGVCVVTCHVENEDIGVTISSFSSLSLNPALILFSIDGRALSLPRWQAAEGYAVNVLADNQQALSNRFARRGGDKWQGTHFRRGLYRAPVLAGAAAVFECRRWAEHDGGDHRLFLAEIMNFTAERDRRSLVFSGGRYARLEQTQDVAPWPLDIHY